MLSMYCAAARGFFTWYSCVSPALLWHLAQVPGRLSLKTGDAGFLGDSMSSDPWQSQQLAAPEAPILWLRPWMLAAYCLTGSSWHFTQLGGCAGTLSSRSEERRVGKEC